MIDWFVFILRNNEVCHIHGVIRVLHYSDVIKGTMASQITSLTIVYSTIYSGADQRKHHSSASSAFVMGTNGWPVNSTHKGPVTRKMFPFGDVIMIQYRLLYYDVRSTEAHTVYAGMGKGDLVPPMQLKSVLVIMNKYMGRLWLSAQRWRQQGVGFRWNSLQHKAPRITYTQQTSKC